MNRVEVRTTVYAPVEEVYEFLLDFPRYADYSEHLDRVAADGEGGVGTDYRLHFSWWKLTYAADTRVTGVDRPWTIDWTVTRDLDASGRWTLTHLDDADREHATRVCLVVTYDPASVGSDTLDLPALVSLDWVIDRVVDLVVEEGARVVERVVADLEGDRRDVELDVRRA